MYILEALRRILIEIENLRTSALDLSFPVFPNWCVNPFDVGPTF